MSNSSPPLNILKSHFGFDSFLPLQEEIITNVLSGRDSLVLLPTGGGKSLCYQLPAMCLPGLTLVVSPLIALMKDQVDALNSNGIPARFINSSLTSSEIELAQGEASRGQAKILYVAPERLAMPGFRHFLSNVELSLIAIDEAHCISEWGHEFRPDYRNLRQLRQAFPGVPAIALTATATWQVREDIVQQLGLQQGRVFLSSFNRANLTYSVQSKEGYWQKLLTLLGAHKGESAIIYAFSRRETEELAEDLNARGLKARPYHAGLDPETRRRTQEDFIRDRVPIIVATIAFGMGIDKPDIRLVAHHSLPKSLEGYYQETGRAGRDGLPSECVLFYSYADKAKQEYFIDQIEGRVEQENARLKLSRMVEFAEIPLCRRKNILGYFGEDWEEENCGSCDVCLAANDEIDATEIAQKVLSAVIRTGERFGALHVSKVLRGSREKRVLELGHDRLSVYGIAKDFSEAELREIVAHLQARALISRNEGEFATLSVSDKGKEFLQQRNKLSLPVLKSSAENRESSGKLSRQSDAGQPDYDVELFKQLQGLRKRLADEQNMAAFVVFGHASLRHMASAMPQSLATFGLIPGVGSRKLEEYGRKFVAVIREYAEAKGIPDQTREALKQARSRKPATEEESPRRSTGRASSTYQQTRDLLAQNLTVAQIAEQRNLAESTIVGQLERMVSQGELLHLEHLLPSPEHLRRIKEAFDVCGNQYLKPAWEYLGPDYTYDELRLTRIFLQQEVLPDG
ncbi:ATP-dependent DNA helicase RecQ [Geodia barretti]|uniref:ATP-dependent DNA helicase n=1 Tax=Geodia barretti TaxID=519541 RepID=A0AA35SIV3_GEOBA|nr:ATP-dependent DNA helicase RecQ [Geodia barretti]